MMDTTPLIRCDHCGTTQTEVFVTILGEQVAMHCGSCIKYIRRHESKHPPRE
jgi:late competence protein required for DNA uptake (superfamily II DNA/RNA helicase)